MKYNLIINDLYTFPLFFWDSNQFRINHQLDLATDNFMGVKNALNPFETLKIVDNNGLEIAYFNNYKSYVSINYIGSNYSTQQKKFCDEIVITLTEIELEQKVKDLEAQVEDLQNQIDELKVANKPVEEQLEWNDLPIDEPVEEPAEELAEEPAEEPVEEPVEELIEGAPASDESFDE